MMQDAKDNLVQVEIGQIVINKTNRITLVERKPNILASGEFNILWFLAIKAGQVVTRDELYNETLAVLYNNLVQFGLHSEENALMVGGTVEDLDIFDIREMRGNTDNAMVIDVYDLLECGSNNHIRSFTNELATISAVYIPQSISAADYESILATSHERCGSGRN